VLRITISKTALFATIAAVLTAWPGASQYTRRDVSGIVTDKRGNSLPGAVVQLEDTNTLNVRSSITDKAGRYHFAGLRDDIDYTLKARYHRFWSKAKTLSKFNSSTHAKMTLIIPID
jgi:hypothetical protein